MLDVNQRKSLCINAYIDNYLTSNQAEKRNYLGASQLGMECSRALQYEFLGLDKLVSPKSLRIFAIGHMFEELIAKWIRGAGFELRTEDKNGEQFGFEVANGRIKGHVDGVILSGPSELDLTYPILWECKSLNNKSWNDTIKRGMVLSKPIYAAQIALYQAYMEASIPGISHNPALFSAINKDTGELYHELVPFDPALAQTMSDKAVNILRAVEVKELLPRIAANVDYYACKMCSWHKECWKEVLCPIHLQI